jgi:4-hydroxy-4-methyl-2-oxoglutarate aldolase
MVETSSLPDLAKAIARFQTIPTGLITDAFLRLGLSGWMDGVLPLAPGSRVVGRARTIAYGPIRRAGKPTETMYALMSRMTAGDVMVMASGGTHDNLLGSNMGTFAQRCGLGGIVTDSRTRDRADLRTLGLPVFSRGAGVRPPIEVELSAWDVDVDCGGAQVRPGDIVVGDDDGVIVVPADRTEEVLYQIDDLIAAEEAIGRTIREGGSLRDIEAQLTRKRVLKAAAAHKGQ